MNGSWVCRNASYTIFDSSITITATGVSGQQSYIIKSVELSKGFYALSLGSYEISGSVEYKKLGIINHTKGGGFVENAVLGENKKTTIFEIDADGYNLTMTIFVQDFPGTGTGTVTVSDMMLEKIDEGGYASKYEPYIIQRDTIFSNPGDRTLVAEWTANSNNLFTNGDFEDVYTQTDTGWDNSINGTLHATGWNDYNGEITNPLTTVHAHIKDISSTDPQHGHVFEMIGAHREYIAALQPFRSTTKITSGTYRVSASIKGVSGQNVLCMGLYYSQTGSDYSSSTFYSGQYTIRFETTEWTRVTYEFAVTKITYASGFYFYGDLYVAPDITPSMNNIFYLDDVFLEKIA